jgi:hypothetical protein
MGVPVDAPSAPKLRLVGILGIVGRTGHFLRSRDGGIARQGYRGYKGGLEGRAADNLTTRVYAARTQIPDSQIDMITMIRNFSASTGPTCWSFGALAAQKSLDGTMVCCRLSHF